MSNKPEVTELEKLKKRLDGWISEDEARLINAKLDSQSNVKLYSLKELYELRKNKEIGIPAVQRGLVWTPSKIVNFWDSIIKGYPIGIFQCYEESIQNEQGEKRLALIDGQQRLNAICLGYEDLANEKDESDEKETFASLWVAQDEKGTPIFMVCTQRHPWGYVRKEKSDGAELTIFSAKARDLQNNHLKGAEEEKEDFSIAKLSDSYPINSLDGEKYQGYEFYHLPAILSSDSCNDAWEVQKKRKISILKDAPDDFIRLHGSEWAINARNGLHKTVPLVTIQNFSSDDPQKLRELFSRINNGGQPLSNIDELYSTICAHADKSGVPLKEVNIRLSKNFLPPERLTRLAARLIKSEMGKNNFVSSVSTEEVCAWFSDKSNNSEVDKHPYLRLLNLYSIGILEKLIKKFNHLLNDCTRINASSQALRYIYLRDSDDHWLYVIFSIIKNFKHICDDDNANRKYFPLLLLLPDVVCATDAEQGKINFCQSFYNTLFGCEKSFALSTLLDIISIGYIGASITGHAFTWPYPNNIEYLSLSDEQKANYQYKTYWLDIYNKIFGANENNILYYYQRRYLNSMLKSGFNPASPATWQGKDNRPWDMDHIIPQSWWSEDPDKIQNEMGNMQVMYFRHNRIKNDSFAGAMKKTDASIDNCLDYFGYWQDQYDNIIKGKNVENYSKIVRQRRNVIIQSICKDLNIFDMITNIGDKLGQELPALPIIAAAKLRFDVFKKLAEDKKFDKWGICTYEWRRQRRNVDDGIWLELHEPTYYNSLITWLIVGADCQFHGVDTFYSVQAEIDASVSAKPILHCIVSYSRPIGKSEHDWVEACKAAGWRKTHIWQAENSVPNQEVHKELHLDAFPVNENESYNLLVKRLADELRKWLDEISDKKLQFE